MLFSSPFVYWNPLNKNSERLKAQVLHRNEETALRVVLFFYGLPDIFLVKELTLLSVKNPSSFLKEKVNSQQ
jgi:hypothetical protein